MPANKKTITGMSRSYKSIINQHVRLIRVGVCSEAYNAGIGTGSLVPI